MKKLVIAGALTASLLSPTLASASTGDSYTVKSGDTLWKVAVKTQTGIQELINVNPQVENINLIYVGQKLNVPAKSGQTEKQKVINLVNQERQKAGLKPLKENWELSRVAQFKAEDMKEKHYFDHNSPTYGSPFKMMTDFGIHYNYAGENIAQGQQTPEAVMQAWMNSQGHRENILSPNFTQIGVGYVSGSNIWVQQFISQ